MTPTRRRCACGCPRFVVSPGRNRHPRTYASVQCANRDRSYGDCARWGREGGKANGRAFLGRLLDALMPLEKADAILAAYTRGRRAAYRERATRRKMRAAA